MNCFSPVTSRFLAWSRLALLPTLCVFLVGPLSAQLSSFTPAVSSCLRQASTVSTSVNLTSLTVRASGRSHILVEWVTEGEIDNNYFEIERSVDGLRFEVVGRVTGKTTIRERTDYNFFDYYPGPGAAHYRLRQVSFRGGVWITEAVAIRTDPGARQALPALPAIGAGDYAYGLLAAN